MDQIDTKRSLEIEERADTFMLASDFIAEERNHDIRNDPQRAHLEPLSRADCVNLAEHDFAMVDCYRPRLLRRGDGGKPRLKKPKVAAFCFLAACLSRKYNAHALSRNAKSDAKLGLAVVLNFYFGLYTAGAVIKKAGGDISLFDPKFDMTRHRLMLATRWYYCPNENEHLNPFYKHSRREFKRQGAIQKFTDAELQHIDYLINIFEMWESAVLEG